MHQVLEPDNVKLITLFVCAIATKIATNIAAPVTSGIPSEWIERGGTALSIGILLYAVKALRAALSDRQKRLDEIHDKDVELAAKNAEAREKLAQALDKLTDKLNEK